MTSAVPLVSVIIPLHRDNPAFRACLQGCLAVDYPSTEIVVVSDVDVPLPANISLIVTGRDGDSGPGEKRDIGMHRARGEFFAFIDDDAVPRSDWLRNAIRHFADDDVGAVGGPGVTPPRSAWRERVGGAFYESWLGSGPYRYRFRPAKPRDVDDYPAYNLIVRGRAARGVEGWGTRFYGGEDTVICMALVDAGWRIRYEPDVVVYHHRRPVLQPHLLQVGNVGRHRGYFVKAYPKTSLRPSYFLPSAGTLALVGLGGAALSNRRARVLTVASLLAYFAAGTGLALVEGEEPSVAVALPGIALASHIQYGLQFLRGLLTRNLDR